MTKKHHQTHQNQHPVKPMKGADVVHGQSNDTPVAATDYELKNKLVEESFSAILEEINAGVIY